MATDIGPNLFLEIMSLPSELRLDLLEFAGSAHVGPIQLAKIVKDLKSLPVDPGQDLKDQVA